MSIDERLSTTPSNGPDRGADASRARNETFKEGASADLTERPALESAPPSTRPLALQLPRIRLRRASSWSYYAMIAPGTIICRDVVFLCKLAASGGVLRPIPDVVILQNVAFFVLGVGFAALGMRRDAHRSDFAWIILVLSVIAPLLSSLLHSANMVVY
jgi:hypothetical protein